MALFFAKKAKNLRKIFYENNQNKPKTQVIERIACFGGIRGLLSALACLFCGSGGNSGDDGDDDGVGKNFRKGAIFASYVVFDFIVAGSSLEFCKYFVKLDFI